MVDAVIYYGIDVSTGCDCIIKFCSNSSQNAAVRKDRRPLKLMNGTNVKLKFYNL